MDEYEKQAKGFLEKHNLSFGAEYKEYGQYFEGDTQERAIYRIRIRRKNNGRSITFNFGQSIAGTEVGEKPTGYDILASISGDITCPYDFGEFCLEYGYNEDSREAERIFKRASKFAKRLNAFFDEGEKEGLTEIQ